MMKKLIWMITVTMVATSCGNDSDDDITLTVPVPSTYTFTRNGASTVDFSGQTARLNMLSEIKTEVSKGDKGEQVSAQTLSDMFANENDAFKSSELNSSGKQLENKTFPADVNFYKDLFADLEKASTNAAGVTAKPGVAGRIERGTSGKFILVNEKGQEFTQFIEKGLMGSVFLNQIYNVYLTDDRIGRQIENEKPEDGKNYTALEHHWDEAFGYWGVPVDFPKELPAAYKRFWAHYAYGREELAGTATALKRAYLLGRTAIVNKQHSTMEAQRNILYTQYELLAAATAIHYINDAIKDLNAGYKGNLLHHLSEAYMFVRALKFNPLKKISDNRLNRILEDDLGKEGDFWTVTNDGLNKAKTTLVSVYQSLADVADNL